MILKSGYIVTELENAKNEEQKKLFKGFKKGVVKLTPGNWIYPRPFINYADKIYDFQFKSSDTVIMSFPKSGTTWMQEIIWNMKHPSQLNLPYDGISINSKCPFVEGDFIRQTAEMSQNDDVEMWQHFYKLCPGKDPKIGVCLQIAENFLEPRIIKTHLPFSMFNPKLLEICKVVFVLRNPKDVCLSFYYHTRMITVQAFTGDLQKFLELFLNDEVFYCPYWNMLKESWERKNHPNFLCVRYEDMKTDIVKEINRLNDFLGTRLSDQIIQKVVEETTFARMKEKDSFSGSCNKTFSFVDKSKGTFFRTGKSGNWKKEFTESQNEKLDRWIEQNSKKGMNFAFHFD